MPRERGRDAREPVASSGSAQQSVRATMARVGGYWRPLAAVARLLEELGELAESAASPAADPRELASELADLWIITTAVADQFLAEVAEPGSHPAGTRAPGDQLSELTASAGRIARIVNYYDGPKTPRSLEGWPSLSDAVAAFQRALGAIAHAHGVDLAMAVADKLRAVAVRDSERFAKAEHDPSTAACLGQFRLIQTTAWGGQIARARLWGAPAWSPQTLGANIAAIVPTLVSFTRAAQRERIDGYVFSSPALDPHESPDDWVRAVLLELARQDPLREMDASETAREPDAHISFNGVLLAVSAFSDLHRTDDPRHSPTCAHILLALSASGRAHGAR